MKAEENGGSGGLVKLNELILCMLGFPCLEVIKERRTFNDKSASTTEGQETVYRYSNDTVFSIREDRCYTERAVFSVKPVKGAQQMLLTVSVDCATGSGEVEVMVGENETACNMFDWQAWKDSFMGRVQGQAEWKEKMVGAEGVRPREEALESILSSPIKNIGYEVEQWEGWPPLYVRMSMVSRQGTFGADRNDYIGVELGMNEAAEKRVSAAKKDDVFISAGGGTSWTLRVQAETCKQEGRSSKALEILCKCIHAHKDPVALDELFVLLRENGVDFVKRHIAFIFDAMCNVLNSMITSGWKRNGGREGAGSAAILLEQLALCYSSLHEMLPEYTILPEYRIRCLFELRDPKILPILREYRAKMNFPEHPALLAAVFCFDQWKTSGTSHMRLLGEAYLETYALQTTFLDIGLKIGYLFEKGILRGRQTVYLERLRHQVFGPYLSVEETACHFVAHSPDSIHVIRKSTATAVRIYERSIDRSESSVLWNRLGLVYLLDNGGLQDLERSEMLLNRAKKKDSKDAMCNLAVLHGFHRGKWVIAHQNLTKAIPDSNLVTDSDAPARSHGFRRPVPENVFINGNVYKLWKRTDICDDPHTSSMNNLAVLYEMEDSSFGDVRQALQLYERILSIDENPAALLNMIMLLKLGPAEVRDETRSESLLRTLQSRLPDNEHMSVLAKSIRQLGALSFSEGQQRWSLAVDELEDCAVFVKRLDDQSGQDERLRSRRRTFSGLSYPL